MISKLSSRFEDALVFATQLHAYQTRKSSHVPYIAHLLSVTALVLESDGSEDAAIAALLHDAVEDQGGLKTLAQIRERFGEHVADIVEACSDAYTTPKPPWRSRKEHYLTHLRTASADAQLVSLADKLHNARSILSDLRVDSEHVWDKFNGGKQGTLWYYRSLVDIFKQLDNSFLVTELSRVVAEIEALANTKEQGS